MFASMLDTRFKCVATLALGSRPRQGGCKVVGQRGKPGRARECEGIDPHIPKGTPTLGVGVSMDSRIFRAQLQGLKPISLKNYLYHWKAIETYMSKMGSHDPFGHLKHKLWPKERPGVKLAI
jgi:hypothetical protein